MSIKTSTIRRRSRIDKNNETSIFSSWLSCFPCSLKYKYVAKQESSGPDAAFLFNRMGINKLTYLPGMYSYGIINLFLPNLIS